MRALCQATATVIRSCLSHEQSRRCLCRCAAPEKGCSPRSIRKGDATKGTREIYILLLLWWFRQLRTRRVYPWSRAHDAAHYVRHVLWTDPWRCTWVQGPEKYPKTLIPSHADVSRPQEQKSTSYVRKCPKSVQTLRELTYELYPLSEYGNIFQKTSPRESKCAHPSGNTSTPKKKATYQYGKMSISKCDLRVQIRSRLSRWKQNLRDYPVVQPSKCTVCAKSPPSQFQESCTRQAKQTPNRRLPETT